MMRTKECVPIPSPLVVFTFGLVIESIKEFEDASIQYLKDYLLTKLALKIK
jgi:hypothetical protein